MYIISEVSTPSSNIAQIINNTAEKTISLACSLKHRENTHRKLKYKEVENALPLTNKCTEIIWYGKALAVAPGSSTDSVIKHFEPRNSLKRDTHTVALGEIMSSQRFSYLDPTYSYVKGNLQFR